MPIAFPQPPRGWTAIWAKNAYRQPFNFVPAPNLANPGYFLTSDTLNGGRGKIFSRANPRNPGVNFALTYVQAKLDTHACSLIEARRYLENNGTLNMMLTGVSRDSTGATLASCQVLVFRTEDKSLVAETTSDVSGNWSLSMLKGGPFFIVEYKAGSPDVFGSSPNNLVAAVVP